MSIIRAIASIRDYTAADTGLGVFFAIDVVDSTWRSHIDLDAYYYVEIPMANSAVPLSSERIAKFVCTFVSRRINQELTRAGEMATCTDRDVLVPGFGDSKLQVQPPENIFQGYRERVRRIPRELGSVVLITNAQETLTLTNHENEMLLVTLEFLSNPTDELFEDAEYRLFLFPTPPDLSLNSGAGQDSLPINQLDETGAVTRLQGQKLICTLHPDLRSLSEIQVVVGMQRIATTRALKPMDAGTIAKAWLSWEPADVEHGTVDLAAVVEVEIAGTLL